MPTIQSSVGLISGLPIADIVDQLMAISEKPRDRLVARMESVQQQQLAISELTALTISIQLAGKRLASESTFLQRTASSSNSELLSARVTGTPAAGTYQFTPVRVAQNHQLVSSGFASLDAPVGAGALAIGSGGFVNAGLDLSLLNDGAGVQRGRIRITDRSGSSAVVDLRFVQTIDDVLAQINNSDGIDVRAVADGDAIRLVDSTGQSISNLSVREVNGGSTAADLGLAGIDVAASEATGTNLVSLYQSLEISQLNDGSGLSIRDELPDLQVQFRDGSALEIDLQGGEISNVGDLLETLNAADPARLSAAIASDGVSLVLNDLTTDTGGTFAVTSSGSGTLADDLGLTGAAVGGQLTGSRIVGSLQGPLLASLGGGNGLGTLGQIDLTDRSGASATVDLSGATTLSELVSLLNDAGLGITAEINNAHNGIVLRDTTGASASNLIVANNADGTETADKLGLTVNAGQKSVDSGSLHLQTIHEGTLLSSLHRGQGVELGSILITDSNGKSGGVSLLTSGAKTIGDVLDLINGANLAVEARINDTGDGIVLVDTAHGTGTLNVREAGTRSTAADLGILGAATEVDIEGTPTQVIDGALTSQLTVSEDDTLQDVVDKINALGAGVTASILNTGGGATPYHIVLTSDMSGAAGEIMLDAAQFSLEFFELAPAQDALLQIGSSDAPGAGVLVASGTNNFTEILGGVELTVGGAASAPVTITVEESDDKLIANAKLLVDQYNKLRDKIDELTYFDADSGSTGLLFASHVTLQIESRLTTVLTSRFLGPPSENNTSTLESGLWDVQSLEELGISFGDDGKLTLDEFKLADRFADDPDAVREFFTHEEYGFAAQLTAAVDSLAGEGDSMLLSRTTALQNQVETYSERIEFYNQRLEREEERLLKYYYNLELAISKLQANQTALASIQPIQYDTSRSSGS